MSRDMLLQDFGFPDSGITRLLAHGSSADNTGNDEDSGNPFHSLGLYLIIGLGFTLTIGLYCCIRNLSANRDADAGAATMVLPQPFPQDARAGYIKQCQSTLVAQRKQAILEHFRTTQVTRKVIDEDIQGATKEQCNEEDLESGVAEGFLALSRPADTNDNATPNASFSAPPEMAPNCCAICLDSYHPGQVVVWSSSCKHIFHEDCIVDYLSKGRIGGERPCPSCRQKFCDLPQEPMMSSSSIASNGLTTTPESTESDQTSV